MAHKIVRIEMVEVGSGHGVKALIRDSRTGRKIAETDVRPFGFDAAVHSDALAEIEGRGWSWDGRGVVKDWEGNHSRPRSARRALPTHLFAAYDWTDSAGELAELGSLRGDSLAAYARAAEANARAHHYADVFAADLVELAAWLGHSGVVSWHEQIKAAAEVPPDFTHTKMGA